jgi:hypothetical protein
MMRRFAGVAFTAVVLLALTAGAHAETRQAFLNAFQEVSVVSTSGRGQFRADIAADETSFEFELSSQDIQGTVTMAHIHVAQPDVAGAIVIHFCGSGGKAACPASPATLTGTITAADVVASANVGRVNSLIAATELQEVIALMRQRSTYVNVHSSLSPGGEVRGNIR